MSIDIDLHVQHHFYDGLYAKQMTLPAGHYAVSHRHSYDHISMLYAGVAQVEVDGVTTEYAAPAFILVKAGAEHKITAIADVTWFCVHETELTEAADIDRVLIMGG